MYIKFDNVLLQADNKTGSAIICEEILKNRDYQLGHSKVSFIDTELILTLTLFFSSVGVSEG